jgi:hypothetical protein
LLNSFTILLIKKPVLLVSNGSICTFTPDNKAAKYKIQTPEKLKILSPKTKSTSAKSSVYQGISFLSYCSLDQSASITVCIGLFYLPLPAWFTIPCINTVTLRFNT